MPPAQIPQIQAVNLNKVKERQGSLFKSSNSGGVSCVIIILVIKALLQKNYKAIYFWNRVPNMNDKEWNGFGNETDTLVNNQF